MAKLKTFADGEVLTASDVNTYLNPEVPAGATVYDTGWLPVSAASGFTSSSAAVRRVGMVLYARGTLTGTLTATTTTLVATAPLAPAAQRWTTIGSSGGFVGWARWMPNGEISIRFNTPFTTSSSSFDLSGLSGLLVD